MNNIASNFNRKYMMIVYFSKNMDWLLNLQVSIKYNPILHSITASKVRAPDNLGSTKLNIGDTPQCA